MRFQAHKSLNVHGPSAALFDKSRALTNGTRSKHERDLVERDIREQVYWYPVARVART
ncbi:Bgt-51962 [Blumeria graminis f. sp. tritici]|uniref:Bgt-51962 n=1 Tax=Blumeria graminis f. sp. tritici TaxID=62690 RepID=A0A9X9MH99_BLUGR|nr:Bgt-51962 [Blumeria graminis f. sp. tritici]